MGLLNKLNANGSPLSDQYSLNGTPSFIAGAPSPSVLDLNGVTPPKYTDNPPQ